MNLLNIAAIVTGGASGLGAATARVLAAAGAKVTVFDQNEALGSAVAEGIGGRFAAVDVTDEDSVMAGLDLAEEVFGAARILVNCAGIGPAGRIVSKGKPHDLSVFRKVLEVNLVGTFNMMRLFAARLVTAEPLAGERGVIINTASIAAFEGQIGQIAYVASKGGIHAMTICAARDLSDSMIRVNTIAPGIFYTPMLMGVSEEFRTSLAAGVPHPKRLGDPTEFAALARFIVQSSYINGETMRIDGALRMAPR